MASVLAQHLRTCQGFDSRDPKQKMMQPARCFGDNPVYRVLICERDAGLYIPPLLHEITSSPESRNPEPI